MKRLLLGLLLLLAASVAEGQVTQAPALLGQKGATLPTNCQIGMLYFDTDAAAGANVYGCTSVNTWTAQGGSGLSNPVTPSQGGTGVANNDAATLTRSGNHALTLTTTNTTSVTLPTSGTLTATVASGTSALGTGAINSGACATVVTTTATGTATTDVVAWGFNADPTSTTGYSASANGMLTIISYPTANNVNFKVCNNTAGSVTPGAVTLNWRITR